MKIQVVGRFREREKEEEEKGFLERENKEGVAVSLFCWSTVRCSF